MPLSHAEIVRRTALPKATVSRLTTTLVQAGFLRRATCGREFELGSKQMTIGQAFIEGSSLLRRATPWMQQLAERLDASVVLAIGDQFEMLYIGYHVSHRIRGLGLGVGSLVPMGSTAIGRAWLWGLPCMQQKELIAQLVRNADGQGPTIQQGIHDSFAELESTGACSMLDGTRPDAYGIALPLHLGFQRVLIALSCGAVGTQPDLEAARSRITPELRRAAAQFEASVTDLDGEP